MAHRGPSALQRRPVALLHWNDRHLAHGNFVEVGDLVPVFVEDALPLVLIAEEVLGKGPERITSDDGVQLVSRNAQNLPREDLVRVIDLVPISIEYARPWFSSP